jgi:radical SAM PhpK family P-methyltransferase
MIDCLLIGHNASSLEAFVKQTEISAGSTTPALRDVNLSFVEFEGRPRTCIELLNDFHFNGGEPDAVRYHCFDFLMPSITYLASYVHKRGFTFDYVNLFHLHKERLRQKLASEQYGVVAITTTFYTYPEPVIEIVRFIREHQPHARIVVGGPHVLYRLKVLTPESAQYFLRQLGADYYIINAEGEAAFAQLLDALRQSASLDGIPNLAYRDGQRFVINPPAAENNSLEQERVRYDLFPPQELGEFVSLRTSKSCPFACAFCDFPEIAGKYVFTPVEAVERELNALRDLGFVTTLTFLDDTFNVPKQRFKDLLRMMIRNRYPFRWNCFFRADHADAEMIALMGRAGCEGVFMGVESGSDAVLKVMNKSTRRADYLRVVPLLRDAGIVSYASIIVGFPTETADTVAESMDLLERSNPDFYLSNIWYGHSVTPIYRRRDEYAIRGSAYNWSHSTMDAPRAGLLTERMFLDVNGPVWLPFDLWSVFYLQRKGMSLDQLKTFVRGFNDLVRAKLAGRPIAGETATLDAMRSASRFGTAAERAGVPA